ncbi:MAG: ROK family protein, partial [Magnetococcales bacterium]|nr:ROK family protein [Magnetococcales bacterium]
CSNSVALIGKPLESEISKGLGRPVRLANDADCFALSEAVDGAGAGQHSVFGVILGTGAGSGLVVAGRPVQGPNGVAGE